ncbi:radical SAM protein, partial [Mycobacterium tuberculosis]|nr:radical SAM protein [Mycobacterium tuberculosis]
VQELAKDATAYRRSGGGVTLSGGEPLVQSDFALELLRACKQNGWSTAMETTGCVSKEIVERVMPLVDHALVDIKAID